MRKAPPAHGASAAPIDRAIAVTPEAAARSSGATTATVYDWRVGTSIWEIEERIRYIAMASGKLGIQGTVISSRLDGRCVNTMVCTRPIRAARLLASNAEPAASTLAAKNSVPSVAGVAPNRVWNQYATTLWRMNPPAKASSAN